MPGLTFPVTSGELILTVVVGHNRDALEKRVASGQPLPSPVLARAVIDTGTNVTCVSRAVLHQLGIAKTGRGKTQTASARESANLFGVSLSITPVGNLPGPTLTISDFVVMELPAQIPGIEVLIGMDILLDCKLLLDGPARQFTLEFCGIIGIGRLTRLVGRVHLSQASSDAVKCSSAAAAQAGTRVLSTCSKSLPKSAPGRDS